MNHNVSTNFRNLCAVQSMAVTNPTESVKNCAKRVRKAMSPAAVEQRKRKRQENESVKKQKLEEHEQLTRLYDIELQKVDSITRIAKSYLRMYCTRNIVDEFEIDVQDAFAALEDEAYGAETLT